MGFCEAGAVVGDERLPRHRSLGIEQRKADMRASAPLVLPVSVYAAKPGTDLPQQDGSYVLRSYHRVALSAKDDVSIDGGRDLIIETDGKVTQTARGDVAVEGQRVSVKASGTLTVEGQDIALKASSIRLG